ncbi:MAG: hypothetical protein WD875_07295 [Pirellulales bacterium]
MAGAPTVAGDRMIGAIVLRGEAAWFFKATGSGEAIAAHAMNIVEFVKSLRFREDGTPNWTLPAGWIQQPAAGSRYATLLLGAGENSLELSVTVLTKNGDDETYLLENVNRWRNQLRLPPTGAAGLERETFPIPLADGLSATIVILPPPADATEQTESAEPLTVKYEVPPGWTDDGAKGERKASFSMTADGATAEIAVTSFPAGAPDIANPISNVNRWRRQIGLAAASPDEIAGAVQEVEIAGHRSLYVELFAPDEANAKQATFAAMFREGGDVWFVKLSGDGAIAKGQHDAFKKFLASIRLEAAGAKPKGATDGK